MAELTNALMTAGRFSTYSSPLGGRHTGVEGAPTSPRGFRNIRASWRVRLGTVARDPSGHRTLITAQPIIGSGAAPFQASVTVGISVALLPVDPPGLSSFESYDAESLSLIAVVNDALVHIDEEGRLKPSLATRWRRASPTAMDFELREGVHFHNGEVFDADSVVATFRAHQHPVPSILGSGVLAIIKEVRKLAPYAVRIETHVPDVMLLHRLFWGQIYPKRVLEQQGREAFTRHPIGTGAYRFVGYERGREIRLERNAEHFAGVATIDHIRLPIHRQKEWLERLINGDVDVAFNLDAHDRVRAERIPGICCGSRPAAVVQWFLLSNRGPLSDARVRRALNHAINRQVIIDVLEHGLAQPLRGIATPGQPGYVELPPYRYSRETALSLLKEAGFEAGFELRGGLVSDTSAAVYFAVREFLARVNIKMDAEIVPRAHWFQRIQGGKLDGQAFEGDFAALEIDNPLFHPMFHSFSALASASPASLLNDPGYDERYFAALTALDDAPAAYERLAQYTHEQALMLFTVQKQAHAAWRPGLSVTLPRSGHFDAAAFWGLRVTDSHAGARVVSIPRQEEPSDPDTATLVEATSHVDTFCLRAGARLEKAGSQRLWKNLLESERRWRFMTEAMLHEVVGLAETRTNLSNVLESTDRIAIVGYSTEGRRLFANRGYEVMFGKASVRSPMDVLGQEGSNGWLAIQTAVRAKGSWSGSFSLPPEVRPAGSPVELFLNVTPARDQDGAMGHIFVFSDFSGEQERIRTAAIRTILENLPYGLFMTDHEARMRQGYSDACMQIFSSAKGQSLEGRKLTDLLELQDRELSWFEFAYEQIMNDILPAEAALSQLPARVSLGERTFSLRGSLVRDQGAIRGVLFTMLDISDLIHAEDEARRQHAIVKVLQYRDSFERFVLDLDSKLASFVGRNVEDLDQAAARNLLHTAKGVLLQFDLSELAARIHHMEDEERISPEALHRLRSEVRQLLHQNRSVWQINPDDSEPRYETTESFLQQFENDLVAAGDAEVRALALRGLAEMRERTASEILGPVTTAASLHAARQQKSVQLLLEGDDVRIPERYSEVLHTLLHLVRNSIDHGIELPAERGSKPRLATIQISIARQVSTLRVEVADDGQGIDTDRVVQKAIHMGLLHAETARLMPESEKLRLVLLPGLSTAESVTQTSGRGVGVAAVRDAVEAAGGKLTISSARGRGARFVLDLPIDPSPVRWRSLRALRT